MFEYAYGFLNNYLDRLVKEAQGPGQLDVCQGCIYNENQVCTFHGNAEFSQLPVGCPKRSDTQKTFEKIKELQKESENKKAQVKSKVIDDAEKRLRQFIKKMYGKWEEVAELQYVIERTTSEDGRPMLEFRIDGFMYETLIDQWLDPIGHDDRWVDAWDEMNQDLSNQYDCWWEQESAGVFYFIDNTGPEKTAQVFAPGPGPWERSPLDIADSEVSRVSPERSGLGPFDLAFPILARLDLLRLARQIAADVNSQLGREGNFIADTKKAQQVQPTNPIPVPGTPGMPPQPEQVAGRCPRCGASIQPGQQACPSCGWGAAMQEPQMQNTRQQPVISPTPMASKLAQYPLCYFCNQAVMGSPFTLVLNYNGDEQLGTAHLQCAQAAEENAQGDFDEQFDFRMHEDLEKETPSFEEGEASSFEPNDEIVLMEDFNNFNTGDTGRIISDNEAEESGFSPVRVDNNVYVIFDKDMDKIELVPLDVIEKSSSLIKVGRQERCPYYHVPVVEIVLDHCALATDDPDNIFGCHDKRCQYHQPTSLEEWKTLLQQQLNANPVGFTLEKWRLPQEQWNK